jgi:hypothetical protein
MQLHRTLTIGFGASLTLVLGACSAAPGGEEDVATSTQSDALTVVHPKGAPSAVPTNYTATPHGFFDPSCVAAVQPGEEIQEDGSVLTTSGTIRTVRECTKQTFQADGTPSSSGVPQPSTTYNNWQENYNSTSQGPLKYLSAQWRVPERPHLANDGQVLYFFNGLEQLPNVASILQPVLAYYGGEWTATSWNCCQKGTTFHGNTIAVNPGDLIVGTVTGSDCNGSTGVCGRWSIETRDANTGQASVLAARATLKQNWAFAGVMEVYGVTSCLDLPASGKLAFLDQSFKTVSGASAKADWVFADAKTPCGYGGILSGATATLDFSSATSTPGSPSSCDLAGRSYAQNACTETKQCDGGSWVARTGDPAACLRGIEANGACVTDTGSIVAQNTCTSTLQCDDGVWVARSSDPSACL